MKLLVIDPGTHESGWVVGDPLCLDKPLDSFGKTLNDELVSWLEGGKYTGLGGPVVGCVSDVIIEEFVPYSDRWIGTGSIATIRWIGRFEQAIWQACGKLPIRVPRREVATWLCNNHKAKDTDIRRALIDRYGPSRQEAIGTKKKPGPLYGVKKDVWLALALAVTWADQKKSIGIVAKES